MEPLSPGGQLDGHRLTCPFLMLSLPGERVRMTGVYEVTHAGHRAMHDALLSAGETFPRCRECSEYVLFRFVREVSEPKPPRISEDPDFGQDELL